MSFLDRLGNCEKCLKKDTCEILEFCEGIQTEARFYCFNPDYGDGKSIYDDEETEDTLENHNSETIEQQEAVEEEIQSNELELRYSELAQYAYDVRTSDKEMRAHTNLLLKVKEICEAKNINYKAFRFVVQKNNFHATQVVFPESLLRGVSESLKGWRIYTGSLVMCIETHDENKVRRGIMYDVTNTHYCNCKDGGIRTAELGIELPENVSSFTCDGCNKVVSETEWNFNIDRFVSLHRGCKLAKLHAAFTAIIKGGCNE